MTTSTAMHALIKAAMVAGGVPTFDRPGKNLPTKPDGTTAQAAILSTSAGLDQYTRATGTRSGRTDRARVTCVGATENDAKAVATKVKAALGGHVFPGCSPMHEDLSLDPVDEPNANPARVLIWLEYSTITKG